MASNCFEIGGSPYLEQGAQVGEPGYEEQAAQECRVLIEQIRRQFGPEPPGSSLQVATNPHDFGNYYTVALYYHDEAGEDYALKVERELSGHWDAQSRHDLDLDGE